MSFTKDKLQKLKDRSATATSIFQKTASDLTSINIEIYSEKESVISEILALQEKKLELEVLISENDKIISNINNFLNISSE